MATGRHDVDDARRALAEADAGRAAVRATRPAPWFVPATAALVAVIALGQLLPWGASLAVSLLAAAGLGALLAANARATGVQTSARHGGDTKAALLAAGAMVVVFGAAALVDHGGERPLAWVVCAVIAAGAILVGARIAASRA